MTLSGWLPGKRGSGQTCALLLGRNGGGNIKNGSNEGLPRGMRNPWESTGSVLSQNYACGTCIGASNRCPRLGRTLAVGGAECATKPSAVKLTLLCIFSRCMVDVRSIESTSPPLLVEPVAKNFGRWAGLRTTFERPSSVCASSKDATARALRPFRDMGAESVDSRRR